MILRLEDGSAWPDPRDEALREADRSARYSPQGATAEQVMTLARAAIAYRMLTTHPAGAEAMIKKLRMLRRAVKR